MRITLSEKCAEMVTEAVVGIRREGEPEHRKITATQLVNDAVTHFLGSGWPDGYFGVGTDAHRPKSSS